MGYSVENFQTYRTSDKGETELMANFSAEITTETRYNDGIKTDTVLTVTGQQPSIDKLELGQTAEDAKPIELPEVELPANDFMSMNWVMSRWGVRAIVYPGSGIKDDLRAAIQLRSKPRVEVIYRHIGWTTIGGKKTYLHAKGGINRTGNHTNVRTQLNPELTRYDLTGGEELAYAARATLALLKITKPEITWPLLAGTLAPLFGQVDFAIHVAGRTGTFKSELMSLFQSHYGPTMDARHLPGSWSSTPNALEALAFMAKNAAFVIDDFVPQGNNYQVKQYQGNADKIIRAQGNQAGRARLTDTSSLQTTMYPRGIILSTGEDIPEGHSVRARMLISELSPGDITADKLTEAQKNRPLYSSTTAHLIRYLAEHDPDITEQAEHYRNQLVAIGHSRTPSMLGRLLAVANFFINWLAIEKVITPKQIKGMIDEATNAIVLAGQQQPMYLEATDPTDQFLASIRNALQTNTAHIRTMQNGIPRNPTLLGWIEEGGANEMPTWKSRGPTIGWIKWDTDELFLDVNHAFNIHRKQASDSLTKQTLLKRLKDAGLLARTDDARERNTVRVTVDGHQRQVLALSASTVLDTKEKPSDEDQKEIDHDAGSGNEDADGIPFGGIGD